MNKTKQSKTINKTLNSNNSIAIPPINKHPLNQSHQQNRIRQYTLN